MRCGLCVLHDREVFARSRLASPDPGDGPSPCGARFGSAGGMTRDLGDSGRFTHPHPYLN